MTKRVLIIQTAFLGDAILTLPTVQVLKEKNPEWQIDFLCIPAIAILFKHNPLINNLIIYDKRGNDSFSRIKREVKNNYDIVISPHRSARSSMLAFFSKAKKRISFDKSSLSFLYTDRVKYVTGIHEIQRNLSLLKPLGISEENIVKPELYVSNEEENKINELFTLERISNHDDLIAVAPGSVWFTKRYPKEKFSEVLNLLKNTNSKIFLIGGDADCELGDYLISNSDNKNIINTIGKLNVLESAELIRRCRVLLTNDSAPLHIANSVGTKVVSLFGATVPQFGFFPYGKDDVIFETEGLVCRPCSIHGGNVCPVGTFICMHNIKEQAVYELIIPKT
ncbi:MAG: glycosyltransferase family 9 protein [Ignavibacteria bacterium]|nr:glycosyltransferase family 9 protein [Ignavibacteria bacterium]